MAAEASPAAGNVAKETRLGRRGKLAGSMLLAALAVSGPAAAEDEFDLDAIVRNPVIGNYKGYAEFKMGHYGPARRIWEALAAQGNAEANFSLGLLHEDGLGTPPDMTRALAHYETAAWAGSGRAQYRLGLLYAAGARVPRDADKARHWLERAAAQGDQDAPRLLATLGTGPSSARDLVAEAEMAHAAGDYARTAQLLAGPAAAGEPRALVRLAWMHEAGQGMPRNLDEAARLFRRAAEAGDAEGQYALAVMLETGRGQPRDPEQAARWLRQSAAQGYAPAVAAARVLDTRGAAGAPESAAAR